MKTLLITAIGGDIAQGVAAILKEARPDVRLIGADMTDDHAGRIYADRCYRVPAASHPDYFKTLQSIAEKEKADAVIPMAEPELQTLLPRLKDSVAWKWITAGPQTIVCALDKWETNRRMAQMGIPVPWTVLSDEGRPPAYPCIFKLRHGWGSRHLAIVASKTEADYLATQHPGGLFQEYLEPDDQEVTCGVYRTREGRVAVLPLLPRMSCGTTTWAKVIAEPETVRMCETIARELPLEGSMNVQLRLTAKGPRIFEINPRFSSTALMRHRLGFSDVLWSLDELEGKQIRLPQIAADQIVVRVYDAAVLKTGLQ